MERIGLLHFEPGGGRWSELLNGYAFVGVGHAGSVNFFIAAEALSELLTPGKDPVDQELGADIFHRFENDIFRIAQREARRQGNRSQLIFLLREHMA